MALKVKTMYKDIPLPKLKSKFKRKWLAALRDGTRTQIDGMLCKYSRADDYSVDSIEGFCCLGVAVESLEGLRDLVDWGHKALPSVEKTEQMFTQSSLEKAGKALKPHGSIKDGIEFARDVVFYELATMNDSRVMSVGDLADG